MYSPIPPISIRRLVLRNTLSLEVTEIPDFKAEPDDERKPVFSDDNITVFSIPIVPTPHCRGEEPTESEASLNESENALKRKREPSPELSAKRPFLGWTVPVPDGPSAPSTNSSLLDRFLADPEFDPVTLEGDEADAWRQLIIEHIFTRTEPSKPQLPPKHTNTALPQVPHWIDGTAKIQEKLSKRGPKWANPAAPLKLLPAFSPPMRDGSTAYIVVGPRVRGKFDVKRAEELGLFGPLRGRVARGETVTFTVDDGTGAKVQRTVRPEDCLGEPESTKVRPLIFQPCYCAVLNWCIRLL